MGIFFNWEILRIFPKLKIKGISYTKLTKSEAEKIHRFYPSGLGNQE